MQKKEKISIPLFVTASILALIFLFVLYFITGFSAERMIFTDHPLPEDDLVDKIYLNGQQQEGDPFLTKQSSLKDMLTGPIITRTDPTIGKVDAPVVLVIFSDFQCGVCHKQEAVFKQIAEKYQDKVRLVWKDYPDKNVSSISFQASLAGRCANEQDKFYPYHDLLFENSSKLSRDKFIELAKQIGLNIGRFDDCLKTAKYQKDINDNILEANALDINGVPFIYVNNQEVMGEIDVSELGRLVELELKK